MSIPIVSVIIPNYNHSEFLEKRIETVINQSFQDFEIIVLDDNSTDDSLVILKKYKNHPKVSHFIINANNSGSPFVQWEKGINLAKGKFIWIAETDDWAEIDFLRLTLKTLLDNQSLGFCIARSNIADSEEKLIGDTFKSINLKNPKFTFQNSDSLVIKTTDFLEGYFLGKSVIHNASSVLFRKDTIPNNLDLIKDKAQLGDTFFWVSLALRSTEIIFINKALNNFRRHDNTLTSFNYIDSREKVITEEFKLLDFIIENSEPKISGKIIKVGYKRLSRKYSTFKFNSNKRNIFKFDKDILMIGSKYDKLFLFKLFSQIITIPFNKFS